MQELRSYAWLKLYTTLSFKQCVRRKERYFKRVAQCLDYPTRSKLSIARSKLSIVSSCHNLVEHHAINIKVHYYTLNSLSFLIGGKRTVTFRNQLP